MTLPTAALSQVADQIKAAGADRRILRIHGGGTKAFYGAHKDHRDTDAELFTGSLQGVCEHEPTELVVTASAGMRLQELQEVLSRAHQSLPFDPPSFGDAATVGGMVAAGLSGPSRANVGSVRDYVLGLHLVNGGGELLQFGGQVMKNVAGYDVSRLMVGSLGQLGVITQVSLKVLPYAAAEATVVFPMEQAQALTHLNTWAGQPLPLNASLWVMHEQGPRLTLRLRGAKAAVASALDLFAQQGGEPVDPHDAQVLWQSVQEQTHSFFNLQKGMSLWRLSVPDTTPELHLPGMGQASEMLLEWGGGLRWLKAPAAAATAVRAAAAAVGGHATLFRAATPGDKDYGVFTPLTPALARIHSQLLAQLDPLGVFNSGRLGLESLVHHPLV